MQTRALADKNWSISTRIEADKQLKKLPELYKQLFGSTMPKELLAGMQKIQNSAGWYGFRTGDAAEGARIAIEQSDFGQWARQTAITEAKVSSGKRAGEILGEQSGVQGTLLETQKWAADSVLSAQERLTKALEAAAQWQQKLGEAMKSGAQESVAVARRGLLDALDSVSAARKEIEEARSVGALMTGDAQRLVQDTLQALATQGVSLSVPDLDAVGGHLGDPRSSLMLAGSWGLRRRCPHRWMRLLMLMRLPVILLHAFSRWGLLIGVR